jgi:hypothetical protein
LQKYRINVKLSFASSVENFPANALLFTRIQGDVKLGFVSTNPETLSAFQLALETSGNCF